MSPAAQKLLEQALALPEDARADLAAALLESLDEPSDPPEEVEAAWAHEIKRRIDEVESGAVTPVPWSEARKVLFASPAHRGRRPARRR